MQDPQTFDVTGLVHAALMGDRNHDDSVRKGASVKDGLRRRAAERGKLVGGPRPFGYRWKAELVDGRKVSHLEIVRGEDDVVRRIYNDTLSGLSQMTIARALTAARVPTATGKREWAQASVRRVLVNPVYRGAIMHNGEEFPGAHEPIVTVEVWERARKLRDAAARTKGHGGGEWPKGQHLFTRGLLRCGLCGAAMIPRTDPNRRGGLYEVYICDGRRRNGPGSCFQMPVDRAQVDSAMWAELQRRWLDLDETRDRLAAKLALNAKVAAETIAQAEREAQKATERLARVQRAFQDGFLEPADYRGQAADLREERAAAAAALERAREHAAQLSERGPALDAEAEMFRRMADLRAAIVDGVRDAAGLNGLRRLLAHMFEAVYYMPVDGDAPLAWPDALPDFDGVAYLAPEISERIIEGLHDTSVPPRMRRGVLPLGTERVTLQT
jgi:hypothetical protein